MKNESNLLFPLFHFMIIHLSLMSFLRSTFSFLLRFPSCCLSSSTSFHTILPPHVSLSSRHHRFTDVSKSSSIPVCSFYSQGAQYSSIYPSTHPSIYTYTLKYFDFFANSQLHSYIVNIAIVYIASYNRVYLFYHLHINVFVHCTWSFLFKGYE